jgi:hypothetical protein
MFAQDRELNRGWSVEGRRYRALEREIANTPGTFFFCCLLYADDIDFPTVVELGAPWRRATGPAVPQPLRPLSANWLSCLLRQQRDKPSLNHLLDIAAKPSPDGLARPRRSCWGGDRPLALTLHVVRQPAAHRASRSSRIEQPRP